MRIKGIKIDEDVAKILNEQDNDFPEGSFAAWYGEDLTGQTYEGDLNCSNKNLTSLFGCPSVVTGHFDCRLNKLTSLKGSPKEVGESFYCAHNELTSLEGSPKEVGGHFYCNDNRLTTLKGAPKEVDGNFICLNNPGLKSLEGIGSVIGEIIPYFDEDEE